MFKIIFWMSVFLIFWANIGYPISIIVLDKVIKKSNDKQLEYEPTVTIMVVAHNEEAVIAEKNGYNDIVFLDDYSTGECAGYPIIGTSKMINELTDCDFIVAIGNNKIREKF